MKFRIALLSLFALLVFAGSVVPAQAQDRRDRRERRYDRHHRHHRHDRRR